MAGTHWLDFSSITGQRAFLKCRRFCLHCPQNQLGDAGRALLTCAGVPGLKEPPDDGVALVTGLLDALALLLVEAVLQENSDVGFILIGILTRGSDGIPGELGCGSFPTTPAPRLISHKQHLQQGL